MQGFPWQIFYLQCPDTVYRPSDTVLSWQHADVQSFFAWHIEDADLYSVNFLHWGAPKVWYCVPPSSKGRFERLAAGMHPDAYRACKGFLRHKDILISPSILKQYNVKYHMVRGSACLQAQSLKSQHVRCS